MTRTMDDLQVISFADWRALRSWLEVNHDNSPGVWVRIFKRGSSVPSVTFNEVLEQGLCFGWSESKRLRARESRTSSDSHRDAGRAPDQIATRSSSCACWRTAG